MTIYKMNLHTPSEFPLFSGEGAVRTRLRTHDWSASPLGEPQTWPRELLAIIKLMLLSGFPTAVAWGRDHYLIYNDAYATILGDRHPEALGRRFQDVWSEVWPEMHPIFENTLAGHPFELEDAPFKIATQGVARRRWFSASFSPIQDADGRVVGIFNAVVETTRRVLSQRRRVFQLELTDRLRDLMRPEDITAAASELLGRQLEVARVGYVEVDAATETAKASSGWTSGELPSMAGAEFQFGDFGPLVSRILRAGEVLALSDVLADPCCAPYASAYAAFGIRSALVVPLMKAGQLRAILYVHEPHVHHWSEQDIAMAEDMAERTWAAVENARAQTGLRSERDQSQHIFDSMAEGFMLLDRNWTVLRINAEGLRATKRSADETVGRNHWDLWPELKDTDLERLYLRTKETGVAGIVELPYLLPEGRRIWFEVRAYPALDGGLAVFFRDITQRRNAQKQLRDADRRKDEFLAMLAHELRNPLAPIGAAAELLKIAQLDEARVRQISEVIARQVEHMTSLVDDLLDVSRVTQGLVTLDKEPLDVRHVVMDAVEQVNPLIQSRRHHLALHLAPDASLLMGDKKRLVQIIANLLNNAAKYTQEGGNIVLSTEVKNDRILLRIRDDGIGMEAALAERVFELFAQAERSSDRSSGGLGLGLALVKSLVALHGGSVTCVSAGAGKGSTFTVCLPLRHGPSLEAERRRDADRLPAVKLLRLLVVDDNADAARMLAMYLEASGHHVLVEHNSRRALERARLERPDACVIDIGLPDMDGNELAQRLRAQPETAHAVLIAATGYGQEQDRENALAAGFSHYLVKPVDIVKLTALLAAIGGA